jgi:hypothetical protein
VSTLAAPLFGISGAQELFVAVVDRSGFGIPGAIVIVEPDLPETDRPRFQRLTDASGRTSLPLNSGAYTVRSCLWGVFSDYDVKTRIQKHGPAYVTLTMDFGDLADLLSLRPGCPDPSLVTLKKPFVPPVPLPRLPIGRTLPSFR